jgi:hypothetical protein
MKLPWFSPSSTLQSHWRRSCLRFDILPALLPSAVASFFHRFSHPLSRLLLLFGMSAMAGCEINLNHVLAFTPEVQAIFQQADDRARGHRATISMYQNQKSKKERERNKKEERNGKQLGRCR